MYQHHVPRGDEPCGKYSVAVKRLDACRKRAIHKAALLVEIARQAIQESRLKDYTEVALGGRVAVVPLLELVLGDARKVQGGTTDL